MLPVRFGAVIYGNQCAGTIYDVTRVLPVCYLFEKALDEASCLFLISAAVKMSSAKHLAQLAKFFSFHRAAIITFSS